MLPGNIVEADGAARALGEAGLTQGQTAEIERVREVCVASSVNPALPLSERAEWEEAILTWMEEKGVNPDHAAPLADTPVSMETLDLLAERVPGSALETALDWIATGCTTRALALDIEKAAQRIHDLVSAVKRFSYMDRPSGPELVDLSDGLADTLAVVGSKARSKPAELTLAVEPELPPVRGTGGEFNQIWLHLIDNALDAISESGLIEISARKEFDHVVVRVVDDGPGVPAELLGKIFDPFFTTKEPGEGTGLGLDIARNIVRRHSGEIRVQSSPGRTEFLVRLPASRES